MRGETKFGLLILAVGLAPALLKKSKTAANYVGDHLIKAGEYLKHEDERPEAPPVVEEHPVEAAAEEPVVEAEVVEEPAPKAAKKSAPKRTTTRKPKAATAE